MVLRERFEESGDLSFEPNLLGTELSVTSQIFNLKTSGQSMDQGPLWSLQKELQRSWGCGESGLLAMLNKALGDNKGVIEAGDREVEEDPQAYEVRRARFSIDAVRLFCLNLDLTHQS